jgi:uncharacterized membrane protein
LLCVATLEAEVHETGNSFYWFLHWNLFLAWIPLVTAFAVAATTRHRRSLALCLGVVWLLFFPNTPYVLTDSSTSVTREQRAARSGTWH